jgi:hypothetical protein
MKIPKKSPGGQIGCRPSTPKSCGSCRAVQCSINQLAMVFIVSSSQLRASAGQFLIQAQQRMHNPTSATTRPFTEMAAVGHTAAQVPQTVQMVNSSCYDYAEKITARWISRWPQVSAYMLQCRPW